MQIRTGEGKSLILGACSSVLALLGFRVRCICYSDYLSQRDHGLFKELFERLGVLDLVAYSTIVEYSIHTVHRKGELGALTSALLMGEPTGALAAASSAIPIAQRSTILGEPSDPSVAHGVLEAASAAVESGMKFLSTNTAANPSDNEILLVDEVDIFFGEDF